MGQIWINYSITQLLNYSITQLLNYPLIYTHICPKLITCAGQIHQFTAGHAQQIGKVNGQGDGVFATATVDGTYFSQLLIQQNMDIWPQGKRPYAANFKTQFRRHCVRRHAGHGPPVHAQMGGQLAVVNAVVPAKTG
jgi:hypothetical protein